MNKARYSFTIKFRLQGFECQMTLREDEPGKGGELVDKAAQTIDYLVVRGAQTTGGNCPTTDPSAAQTPKDANGTPFCPVCHKADLVELIEFEKNGAHLKRYKCSGCNRWLPSQLQPK